VGEPTSEVQMSKTRERDGDRLESAENKTRGERSEKIPTGDEKSKVD